jgi:TRAP-type C4-dicarboxylate transport system substrate-binding protein
MNMPNARRPLNVLDTLAIDNIESAIRDAIATSNFLEASKNDYSKAFDTVINRRLQRFYDKKGLVSVTVDNNGFINLIEVKDGVRKLTLYIENNRIKKSTGSY